MAAPLCTNKIGPYLKCKQSNAGINAIIFMHCNATTDFCTAPLDECFFKYVDDINANLTSNSAESFHVYRCFSPINAYQQYTITIEDYNTNSNLNSDFYTFLLQNYQYYKIGWLTCEGLLYGFYNMSITHSLDISNDFKNLSLRKIQINFLNGRNSISIIPYSTEWLDYIKTNQNFDCNTEELITTEEIICPPI